MASERDLISVGTGMDVRPERFMAPPAVRQPGRDNSWMGRGRKWPRKVAQETVSAIGPPGFEPGLTDPKAVRPTAGERRDPAPTRRIRGEPAPGRSIRATARRHVPTEVPTSQPLASRLL